MKLETLQKDYCYHIYNRGINGENIFTNDGNKEYFLKLYKKLVNDKVSTLVYCLLNNHFHFILRIEEDPLVVTQAFSNFFNAYVKAFNKQQDRTGSLFEKHFKRIQLKDENYLRNLILYVHLNPKIHFGGDFEKFQFSSYQAMLSEKNTLLAREEVLLLFDGRNNFEYVHHLKKFEIEEKFRLE